jgi:hypothetical protein
MTTSAELATVAMWMMIIGGMVGVIGLVTILKSDRLDRGDLSTPLTIVGFGLFFLGVFLDYRWGTFW